MSAIEQVVKTAIHKIETETISMPDLLKTLAPTPEAVEVPENIPLPVAITESQRAAIERITEVYGQVVPADRRRLLPEEVSALVVEKQTLKELEDLVAARHQSIRTTVFNHLDIEVEAEGPPEDAVRDDKGHWVIEGTVYGEPGTEMCFKREVRQGSPSLDVKVLEALAASDEYPDFTHEDYLAMTTQTRVVDENKVMLALKKNPELVRVIAEATNPGRKTASLYMRKPKR